MMTTRVRVTDKQLRDKITAVNRHLGFPDDAPYSTVGAWTLYGAYGATAVERYVNDSGATRRLFGLATKRECATFLDGVLAGFDSES